MVHPQHVAQRTSDKEKLLLQPENLTLHGFIVRVENLSDVLRRHFILDRTVVISMVERSEVEGLDRFGLPETHRITGANPVTEDRRIIGYPFYHRVRNPRHAITTQLVSSRLGVAAKLHVIAN